MRYIFLPLFVLSSLCSLQEANAKTMSAADSIRVISVDRDTVSSNGRLTVWTQGLRVSVGDEVVLFLDDYPMETITSRVIASNSFSFDLDPAALHDFFFDRRGEDIRISVGKKGGTAIESAETIQLSFYTKDRIFISWLAVILIALILYLLVDKVFKKQGANGLLKNGYGKYSLSRFVVIFWTSIILFTTIYFLINTGHLPKVTDTILGLLGISVASSVGAQVANSMSGDKTKTKGAESEGSGQQEPKPKPAPPSKSMLTNGFSSDLRIDRLQALSFNLIYGGYFIYEMVFRFYQPEFDTNTLLLLGISNGLYVGIKPAA